MTNPTDRSQVNEDSGAWLDQQNAGAWAGETDPLNRTCGDTDND